MKKLAIKTILGLILRAVLKNKGVCNQPRMDQLEFFSTFIYTKSELKGGLFFEKKLPTHVFGQMNVSANQPKLDQFLTFNNIFLNRIKIQRGYIL